MGSGQITLLLVDDHPLFRRGVRLYLETVPDLHVAGEADNGESALHFLSSQQVDVVLLDLQMPGLDGIETARRIAALHPQARVLILTSFGDWERVWAALKAGAAGYVLKDAEPEELEAAIRAVAAGGNYLGSQATAELLQHIGEEQNVKAQPQLAEPLSPREEEVLALIARGFSNREISERLFVSETTVKTHVANILQKLNVKSRTQAALVAMRRNLPSEEPPDDKH